MSELLKKLIKEEFNGKKPNWKNVVTLGGAEISRAEDDDNYYYNKNGSIYLQSKDGDGRFYCYGCGREIKVKLEHVSVQYRKFSSPGGKIDIKYKYIPYCPECEGCES